MKTSLLLFLFVSFVYSECTAQYNTPQNYVWTFGMKASVNFGSGSPVPDTSAYPLYEAIEGSASVCDTAGNLLFYTNGKNVYDRTHTVMPSGADIVPFYTRSTTQGAVIMPVIGSTTQYYVFSLETTDPIDSVDSRLVYCIVDMSLNGGYGDVVSSSIGIPIEDSLSEKMVAIAGNRHRRRVLCYIYY